MRVLQLSEFRVCDSIRLRNTGRLRRTNASVLSTVARRIYVLSAIRNCGFGLGIQRYIGRLDFLKDKQFYTGRAKTSRFIKIT